jgi:nicotinamide-nucleotide amidase
MGTLRELPNRPILQAEILAVGSELTTGDTGDTNSGTLARELTRLGVAVTRLTALPDDLDVVRDAFARALESVDLVVSTGGIGPTPDDLTREAIAAATGTEPYVDPDLERWLRDLFERRGLEMAERNRKQAWLIDGAEALANPNGTAPGWWVDRPGGRVIVAMPGPPREMQPMWDDEVLPRLRARGVGGRIADVRLRLAGIGESAAAELIGDALLASPDPSVATYARADAVDVRIVARGEGAEERVAAALAEVEARVGQHVFARGGGDWVTAIGERLGERRLGVVEIDTGGSLIALLGTAPWLVRGELLGGGDASADGEDDVREHAIRIGKSGGVDVGICVRARERDGDMAVTIAVATADGVTKRTRTAFLGGEQGRRRAAIAASLELWERLAPGSDLAPDA